MFRKIRSSPVVPTLAVAIISLAGSATANADLVVGYSAKASGYVHYPNTGPDSIGNETQAGDAFDTGFLVNAAVANANRALSRQGVDGNGTSGTASFDSSSFASMGYLSASVGSTASSVPNGPFPHANGGGSAGGSFSDLVRLFDRTRPLGAPLDVRLTGIVEWSGLGEFGANKFFSTDMSGNTGIFFGPALSMYGSRRSDVPGVTYLSGGFSTFTVNNGDSIWLSAALNVNAGCSVGGFTTDAVSASANSGATLRVFLDAEIPAGRGIVPNVADFSAIGATGHDYVTPTPGSAALLVLAGVRALRRRR